MKILGIESSCDETAAAIVENGTRILSSVVSSQVDIHHKYGGVVPELASRMHIESILPVVTEAVEAAAISMDDIDGVAVTRGPGLIGALLVGFSFAKAFAWARKIPWTGVNHLEGHIYSVLLTEDPPPFPFVILLASGGHTNLYHVSSYNDFELMGQTRDDAAGEAFDKVAKMLGLGYPGGAVIERLAEKGDAKAIPFPKPFLDKKGYDFSFSGLKSAVARYIHDNRAQPASANAAGATGQDESVRIGKSGDRCDSHEQVKANIAASFQGSVVEVLSHKLIHGALEKGAKHIAIGGGVAANGALRRHLLSLISSPSSNYDRKRAKDVAKLKLHTPPLSLCGDNAAMIAARGYRMIQDGRLCQLDHDVFSRTRI